MTNIAPNFTAFAWARTSLPESLRKNSGSARLMTKNEINALYFVDNAKPLHTAAISSHLNRSVSSSQRTIANKAPAEKKMRPRST